MCRKGKNMLKRQMVLKNVLKRRNVRDTKVNTMTTIETISWSKRNDNFYIEALPLDLDQIE